MKQGNELGDNYESAPWLSFKNVWTRMVEKGKQGTDVGKASDFCRILPKCSFDWLGIVTKISVTVEKLQSFFIGLVDMHLVLHSWLLQEESFFIFVITQTFWLEKPHFVFSLFFPFYCLGE